MVLSGREKDRDCGQLAHETIRDRQGRAITSEHQSAFDLVHFEDAYRVIFVNLPRRYLASERQV